MQNITIYPYHTGLLPIVRNFEVLQEKYKISQLAAFPGSGLTEKDAGYVCNQPSLNITVSDSLDMKLPWSVLLLDGEQLKSPEKTEEVLAEASAQRKKIFSFEYGTMRVPQWRKELYQKFSVQEYQDTISLKEIEEEDSIHEINTPVILVGGLVEQADTLETACTVTRLLRERGLKVEVITGNPFGRLFGFHDLSPLFDEGYFLGRTVENINKYIYTIQKKTMPDVIVLCAPDSMIQYNSIVPNGYGIKTYMVCQAVCPDYCFCCVPKDLGEAGMIDALSEDFKGRYGVEISGVHISNLIIDSMQIIQDRMLSFSYVDMIKVEQELEKDQTGRRIPVFNSLCRADLLEKILDDLMKN